MARRLGSAHQGDPERRRESSAACKGWVSHYGTEYRALRACSNGLKSALKSVRMNDLPNALHYCSTVIGDVVKRDKTFALEIVARCVRRGFSHGVTQRRRRG